MTKDKTTIKEFMPLQPPQLGTVTKKWVVFTADDMFIVLLKTRELGYGPEHDTADFEFDTEQDALFASGRYYNQNLGRTYPYFDRLLDVLDENQNA